MIATEGPYAVVRHPRYASEALMNIVLFLFTGFWIPLLGMIGWPTMYCQAQAEEHYLLMAAEKEYDEYRSRVGMFFPKLGGKRPASNAKS
jgi:protein-S-isoprenylcysteine O-methyltransferase Ste14